LTARERSTSPAAVPSTTDVGAHAASGTVHVARAMSGTVRARYIAEWVRRGFAGDT
jgi:hypothetical protein